MIVLSINDIIIILFKINIFIIFFILNVYKYKTYDYFLKLL